MSLVCRLTAETKLVLPAEDDPRESLAQPEDEPMGDLRRQRRVRHHTLGVEVVDDRPVGADRESADSRVCSEPPDATGRPSRRDDDLHSRRASGGDRRA